MNNLRILLFCFSISIIYFSCKKHNEIEKQLTENNVYWLIEEFDSVSGKYKENVYYYQFLKNHKAYYLHYNFEKKILEEYKSYDEEFPNSWNLNDNLLTTPLGFKIKLTKVRKDTIYYLAGKMLNRKGRLIKKSIIL